MTLNQETSTATPTQPAPLRRNRGYTCLLSASTSAIWAPVPPEIA